MRSNVLGYIVFMLAIVLTMGIVGKSSAADGCQCQTTGVCECGESCQCATNSPSLTQGFRTRGDAIHLTGYRGDCPSGQCPAAMGNHSSNNYREGGRFRGRARKVANSGKRAAGAAVRMVRRITGGFCMFGARGC